MSDAPYGISVMQGVREDEGWDSIARRILVQADTMKRGAPFPSYSDEMTRSLSEQLHLAYAREEAALSAGDDEGVALIREDIKAIKRKLREGGQLHPGDLLGQGQYSLLAPIRAGGFATVWKAFDRQRREVVAAKVLHGQWTRDESRRERFFRGAEKMEKLHHPAVVRVYRTRGEDGGFYYFVMEFVPGQDLEMAVREGRLEAEDALLVALRVGDALHAAHEAGLVHRDVKPSNVLLDKGMRPKLTDFDLVRAEDTTGGTRTGAMGTLLYTAPEAWDVAKDVDHKADQYSLAMTLVFALKGEGLSLQTIRDIDAVVRSLPCSPDIKVVISKALQWAPEARFDNVQSFCGALQNAMYGSG